jgi:hypothetical protein
MKILLTMDNYQVLIFLDQTMIQLMVQFHMLDNLIQLLFIEDNLLLFSPSPHNKLLYI